MADATATPPPSEPAQDPNEGPGKGKAFFDRARTVATTGNFDYAIDMFIEGLFREPGNVDEHKALREVAMRRQIGIKSGTVKAGGGLFGGGPKAKYKGKTPKEALLNNVFTLARDVGNIPAMQAIIRNAMQLELKDLVLYVGPILKEANRTSKTPKLDIYIELANIYAHFMEFERSCESINEASRLKPQDGELVQLATEYAAKATINKGQYDKGESFQKSIKDQDMTKQLLEEENLGRSEEYRKKMLEQTKADYEANPKELQVIAKYTKALIDMDEEEYENQAIALLKKAFADTQIYRLKAGIGDIRMKQFKRNLRVLKEAYKADPSDKETIAQYEALNKERLAFELEEFRERADQLATDMAVRHEYGKRLWEAKRYDDAIVAFQLAQNNPKHRVDALHFLGRSFLIQGMKPEAVDTLKRSIDEYDLATTGDGKSKELHYWFGRALEANGQLKEAVDIYSKIVRWEIGYLDARKRLDDLRKQLEGEPPPPEPT